MSETQTKERGDICLKNAGLVFSIEPDIAEELAVLLREKAGESIKVVLKVKKDKVKGFRIDLESLAEVCGDERFQDMELLCWGFNEKSFREL